MADLLPEEAKVLGQFRSGLENWAAERKLTTWGALDVCNRGAISRRVFQERCEALGLSDGDKAFRVLDVKGRGAVTAKDIAKLKNWAAYNQDGTKRASMLEDNSHALKEKAVFESVESSAQKRAERKAKMHQLILTQTERGQHASTHSVLRDMYSSSDTRIHVPAPRRKHECKACAVSLAADHAVQYPTTWMQKLGVERKPPPGKLFLTCFPVVGELLDKESPYIDPALLEAKVRIAKPAEGKFRRQRSSLAGAALSRGSLLGQATKGRKRAAPLVQG
jgi:hypothetical protein